MILPHDHRRERKVFSLELKLRTVLEGLDFDNMKDTYSIKSALLLSAYYFNLVVTLVLLHVDGAYAIPAVLFPLISLFQL